MRIGNLSRFSRIGLGECLELFASDDEARSIKLEFLSSSTVQVIASQGGVDFPVGVGCGFFPVEFAVAGDVIISVVSPDPQAMVAVSDLQSRAVDYGEASFTNLDPKPMMSAEMALFTRMARAQQDRMQAERDNAIAALRADFESRLDAVSKAPEHVEVIE